VAELVIDGLKTISLFRTRVEIPISISVQPSDRRVAAPSWYGIICEFLSRSSEYVRFARVELCFNGLSGTVIGEAEKEPAGQKIKNQNGIKAIRLFRLGTGEKTARGGVEGHAAVSNCANFIVSSFFALTDRFQKQRKEKTQSFFAFIFGFYSISYSTHFELD